MNIKVKVSAADIDQSTHLPDNKTRICTEQGRKAVGRQAGGQQDGRRVETGTGSPKPYTSNPSNRSHGTKLQYLLFPADGTSILSC